MKLLDLHLRGARAIIANLGVAKTVNCLLQLNLLRGILVALASDDPFVLIPREETAKRNSA